METKDLFATLDKIVEEVGPGFTYNEGPRGCLYEPNEAKPYEDEDGYGWTMQANPYGCVIGYMGRRLGFKGEYVEEAAVGKQEALLDYLGIDPRGPEAAVLAAIQQQQDGGDTWADAVEAGRKAERNAKGWGA